MRYIYNEPDRSQFEAGEALMKKNIGKRLLCCLLAALFILCCVPLRSEADGQYGTITFSTMKELRGFCDEAKNFSGKSLSC